MIQLTHNELSIHATISQFLSYLALMQLTFLNPSSRTYIYLF